MRRLLLPTTAVVTAVALAGCGSTVATGNNGLAAGGAQTGSGTDANGLGAPAQGAPGGALSGGSTGSAVGGPGGAAPAGGSAGAGSSGSGASQAGGTTGGATTAGGSAGTTGGGALGPGVTATTINVGVVYTSNGDAGNSAIGGGGIARSDEKANADAVIDEINAHGGVAGRKLKAVYATYDATSAQPPDALDQAACDKLTKDNKILAVFTAGLTDVFPACMQKAGVTIMASGVLIDQDRQKLRTFPTLIQLGTLVQERMMRELPKSLERQKYFTGWNTATGSPSAAAPVKVGIITVDDPQWLRPLRSTLLPGLAALGHKVAEDDVQQVPMAHTTGDAGAQARAVSSAVLRLRSDNVTHVIMLDASATVTIFFATAAKNQGYYPRLGANSATGMQALTDAGVGGNDIFEGAVGLGWFPNLDLPTAASVKRQGPETKKCLDIIYRRTGQRLTGGNAASLALSACDGLFFFKAVAERAGGRLDQAGLIATTEGLGTAFVGALYGATRLGPQRHDALEVGYDMAWDTSCTCATYTRSFAIPT